jgi:hypothetical protein
MVSRAKLIYKKFAKTLQVFCNKMEKIQEKILSTIRPDLHYHDRLLLSRTWAQFIIHTSFHWKWYGHFTFKDFPHQEAGHKVWMKFIHILNRAAFRINYWKCKSEGVTWVRATEYQSRGALHYHALIGNIPDRVNRFDFMKLWESLAGFSRIYHYREYGGAEEYISKSSYAFKQGQIDLSDTLKYHIDESVIGRIR